MYGASLFTALLAGPMAISLAFAQGHHMASAEGDPNKDGANRDWLRGSVRDAHGLFTLPWMKTSFPPNFLDVIKWKWGSKPPAFPTPEQSAALFPVIKPDWTHILAAHKSPVSSLTWLGHASCYVRLGDATLLTDPVFSARCSPVQFSGPLRYVAVPCPAAEIPTPGFVLISHDHYDHLDYNTITALEDGAVVHGRPKPVYVMGLGLKSWFVSNFGIEDSRLVELDWWQSYSPNTHLRIDFVPAQHWGKRSLLTHMDHLWGGFVVKDTEVGKSFFFAGDTGFSEQVFGEIGNRYGPVDMAAIPIGAYEPRWFMSPQHVDPEQAYAIHRLVKAKRSVGIHWGTFILTDEPVEEPRMLIKQINEANAEEAPFVTIEHGATINF